MCVISLPILPSWPGLHKIVKHFAKTCAVTAFMNRMKSMKLVQVYFLMSIYGLPVWWWEEGWSLFYGGLASRIVTSWH